MANASDLQYVLTYSPARSLPQGYQKTVTKPAAGINLPLFGLAEAGKSALAETLEHIIRKVPLHRFRRQGAGGFTPEPVPVPLTDCITLIDTSGSRLKRESLAGLTWGAWLGGLWNWTQLKAVEVHCPIMVWPATDLKNVSLLKDVCLDFKKVTGCEPIVVITKMDKILKQQDPPQEPAFECARELCAWVQSELGSCGNVFSLACYTKYSTFDAAAVAATNEIALQILSVALDTTDEMLLRRKVGKIIFSK
jgi:hypothetical protein